MEESSFLLTRLIALIELDEGTSFFREQGKKKEISTHPPLFLFGSSFAMAKFRKKPRRTDMLPRYQMKLANWNQDKHSSSHVEGNFF